MRLLYLDESGVSNRKHEPVLIVAGICVDADKQLVAVEDRLDALIEEYIPEEDRPGFCFHATEIFSGGRYFDRDKWPFETRLELLDKLAAIPSEFGLRLAYAAVEKAAFSVDHLNPQPTAKEAEILQHATAFLSCTAGVEAFMRKFAPNEVAMVIAEDRPEVKSAIKGMHGVLQSVVMMRAAGIMGNEDPFSRLLPYERIRDTVHFAGKRESKMLQLADLVAFAAKRYRAGKHHADRLYDAIKGQIVWAYPVEAAQSS